MTDTNVIKLAQPGTFTDSLTEILRNGAHALLAQAIELEVANFIGRSTSRPRRAGSGSCATDICPSARS
jgi:putative transposase